MEDLWGYQACTEQFMPFSRDGENDMFWPQVWGDVVGCTSGHSVERCRRAWLDRCATWEAP